MTDVRTHHHYCHRQKIARATRIVWFCHHFHTNIPYLLTYLPKQSKAKQMSELKEYTLDQVAKHTTTDSCWLVIGNDNNGECRPVDLCRRLFCRWRNLVFVFFVKQWQCKSHTNETTIGGRGILLEREACMHAATKRTRRRQRRRRLC